MCLNEGRLGIGIMTTPPSVENMSPSKSASAADVTSPSGLTSEEARRRWEKFGPNTMPDTALHPLRMAIEKFWAPVPWMLEAAIVLEVALGKYGRGRDHRRSLVLQSPSDCSRRAAPKRPLPH